MNKKMLSLTLASVLSVTTLMSGCGGLEQVENPKDKTKSQLQISVRDSGYGTNWFSALARGFEEKYANVSFEEGKMGVQVTDLPKRDNAGSSLLGTIKSSNDAVLAVEGLHYVDYASTGLLYDLSDVVDDELDDGSGTIVSKISQDNKDYLTGYDGKYYALPWFSSPLGVTYDANLFAKRNFYFADANGEYPSTTSSYTGKAYTGRGFVSASNTKKSCGPDGKYDTFDDGLPSSYEEFFYMLDRMYTVGVDGFVYYAMSEHYLNYLFHGLLTTYSGYDEMHSQFSFDSGEGTMRIITSFDDNSPVVENIKINEDNGYLTSQMEGKYYALKFLEHLFKNTDKYVYSGTMSLSNVDAQRIFIESDLSSDYNPIAMIVEGNYWYNEAEAIFKETESIYPNAENRNFRFMSLPQKELGSVNAGEGRTTTLSDGGSYYFMLNNNISNDPVKEELAIKFIKYCYEDASLQLTTTMSGLPVLADYELTTEQYNSMDHYKQGLWDITSAAKKNGQYLTPVSGSKIFLNSFEAFHFASSSTKYFTTVINGVEQEYPRRVFTSNPNLTAKDYFLGMKISESTWDSKYNIFG